MSSSEEKDSKAKESARASAPRSAQPGAVPVKNTPPTTAAAVAAVAPAEQHAAALDQRIAEKQQARAGSFATTAATATSRRHLSDVVAAKQRGALSSGGGNSKAPPSKPGAYAERTAAPKTKNAAAESPSILTRLEAFERDVEAKTRAAAPGATSVRHTSGSHSPEAAKIRREQAAATTGGGGGAQWDNDKAMADLTRLEDSVSSKVRAAPAATKPGAVPVSAVGGSGTTPAASARWDDARAMGDLARLEDSVTSKVRAVPTTTKPGAVSVSNGGDASAPSAKNDQNAIADLTRLEDAAISKARGASTGSKPGAISVPNSESDANTSAKIQREGSNSMPPGVQAHFFGVEGAAASCKVRRQSPDTTPGAQALLQTMEDSVGSKIRREGAATTAAAGGVAGPGAAAGCGAFSDIRMAEDSVASKVRGVSVAGATAASSPPRAASGAGQAAPTSLQESVSYKVRAEDGGVASRARAAASSGAPADLGRMQGSLLNKLGDQGTTNGADLAWSKNGPPPAAMESAPTGATEEKTEKQSDVPEPALVEMATSFEDHVPANTDMEIGGASTGGHGLAVAVAVEEEDDDLFIPSAVQYDPDAKPPMYKNRRFRLYGFLAFFIIVVVAIGASIAATLGRGPSTPAPTMAPTTVREGLGIRDAVERVVGSEFLDDPDSPYAKALDWITFDDPQHLSPKEGNFIQRYIAAYLYFATSVEGPWRSCGPPKNPKTDSPMCSQLVLGSLFPEVFDKKPSNAWLSSANECDWAGIICDDQLQVRTVDLSGSLLTGSFPEGVVHFLYLQELALYWNNLTGTLPPHVVDMDHLISIELHFNKFTGSIPNEWWNAKNLQRVNVGENLITGSIPTEVGNLRDMKGFFVMTNLLTGTLPEELGVMDSVTYFRLSRNSFEGSIPSSFTKLKNANEGWFHRNKFTGKIPEDIGSLDLLADLRLHVNPISGSIPESLWDLDKLWRLDLYECNFTGTLSEGIGKLGKGFFELHINNNKFEGPLPQNMSQLVELYDVWIHNNDFTGTVPQALCDLKWNSASSVLEVFQADCAADSSGNIELSCPSTCCTTCCKGDGTDCLSLDSSG